MNYIKIPSKIEIDKTIQSLKNNGINAYLAKDKDDAKKKVFSLIDHKKEIMTMTSITLDELGITSEINSVKFNSVRKKFENMDKKSQHLEMQRMGAAPEIAIGSVHAVTEDGKVIVASNTGSQMPAYVYGANEVIWVVGIQKIVKNLDEGLKRIYDYVLPLESERARKAYGVEGSFVSKLLVFNKEIRENRIHLIFVPEKIGY